MCERKRGNLSLRYAKEMGGFGCGSRAECLRRAERRACGERSRREVVEVRWEAIERMSRFCVCPR